MRLYLLTRSSTDMAVAEISALTGIMPEVHGNIAITEEFLPNLAYCKRIENVLFRCVDIESGIDSYGWNLKGTFAVEISSDFPSEKSAGLIGALIEKKLGTGRVDLKKPDNLITVYSVGGEFIVTLLEFVVPTDFMQRRAHLRPGMHPSSMHPRLARACVNLAGPAKKILDPFCGSGGILIEAGLMGREIEGYDIIPKMIELCRLNLNHYGIRGTVKVQDAFSANPSADAIVTDLPYGKNTVASESIGVMFGKLLKKSMEWNIKRMVVMIPKGVDVDLQGFVVRGDFTHYLHKSLSKRILLLECPD